MYTQFSSLVIHIERCIYLDDLQHAHAACFCNLFHSQMRFAIGQSTANQRARAGRIARIQSIDVKRHCVTCGRARSDRDRVVHARSHAAFIDLSHREETNSQFVDQFPFTRIDVACTDVSTKLRIDFRCETANIRKLWCAVAKQRGQRHSVNVAGRSCLRGVHIGVRVEPDQSQCLFLFSEE